MEKRGQAVEETVGLIAQAEAEYETLMNEVNTYWDQAKQLRKQANDLKNSGSANPQIAIEVSQLLEQATYIDQLGDEKEGLPRLEILRRINLYQREAEGLRETIQFNKNVLERKQQELIEVEQESARKVMRAQESIRETERLLADQVAKLAELEGNSIE
ncbi:hypothetical protein [uncultured Brevibacillus sp.]|uniref:hypothetical protein n=1 Tax=uncultured Brevibacillus sp. TaxID=169970 RepID=UPI0025951FF4|nr:hypothetical protein [uncultured Brevibacillus sp.]